MPSKAQHALQPGDGVHVVALLPAASQFHRRNVPPNGLTLCVQ